MQIIALLLFTLISFDSYAEAENPCFNAIQRHVREAIAHNRRVAPLYKELSQGRSSWLSSGLISLEKFSLLLTAGLEKKTRVYQEKGIPLLCAELAEMKDVPPFRERLPSLERPTHFYSYDIKILSENIEDLMKKNKLEEAYDETAHALGELENYPNQLCLTRHLLESIARTLLLTEGHRNGAKNLGLPDPLPIIKSFIKLQRRSLGLFHYLDRKAFPLQKEGLLIYCQDIPSISWKPID